MIIVFVPLRPILMIDVYAPMRHLSPFLNINVLSLWHCVLFLMLVILFLHPCAFDVCPLLTAPQNSIVIVDMNMPNRPLRMPITADYALMNPNSKILALKAQVQGTNQDRLQIFNIELKTTLKSHLMPEQRPQMVKGNMQLFSVDQQRSQGLEAHTAAFTQFKVPGIENPSTLISFTTKPKLHIIELGAQPVYTNRISPDPIFLTAEASSLGGFYAINKMGKLNTLELADILAERGDLPGAENLATQDRRRQKERDEVEKETQGDQATETEQRRKTDDILARLIKIEQNQQDMKIDLTSIKNTLLDVSKNINEMNAKMFHTPGTASTLPPTNTQEIESEEDEEEEK
ncbi:hypothetical protein TIFTF001_010506 [Ficus carica]|uniref:Uncharacterized protein n=1 Tax=Ficus carica TaxID=3494 RepID=A0AA88D3F9_FICCA|nr:hypothetical protein TIFTF001_010506 [Ficus carica]